MSPNENGERRQEVPHTNRASAIRASRWRSNSPPCARTTCAASPPCVLLETYVLDFAHQISQRQRSVRPQPGFSLSRSRYRPLRLTVPKMMFERLA